MGRGAPADPGVVVTPLSTPDLCREITRARSDELWARINAEPGLESIAGRKIDRLLDELSARLRLAVPGEVR